MSSSSVNFDLAVKFVKDTFEKAIAEIDEPLSKADKNNLFDGLIILAVDKAKEWGWSWEDWAEIFIFSLFEEMADKKDYLARAAFILDRVEVEDCGVLANHLRHKIASIRREGAFAASDAEIASWRVA